MIISQVSYRTNGPLVGFVMRQLISSMLVVLNWLHWLSLEYLCDEVLRSVSSHLL